MSAVQANAVSLREFGELAQPEGGVAGDILAKPTQVARPEDHEHAIVRRIREARDIAVDPYVPAKPVGDQVSARPIVGLPEVRHPVVEADVLSDLVIGIHVEQRLEDGVRRQVLVLRFHHGTSLALDRVQLLRAAVRLGVVHEAREGELAVDIHRVHGLVAQLLGEAEADLLDLVTRELVLARDIVGVALGDAVVPDVAFDRDLRGMEFPQDFDELGDLGLALGRERYCGFVLEMEQVHSENPLWGGNLR